ncbi:hypothetical protein IC006_0491 [Sulfuracidifex tepidarius]|uniref:Uncharacterized protein n=1 Tax=Sulfuracidifex tepidarius TaxID=1294262 RepID=A0A510E0C4_9CREN|nr:hypothetical protein [Sulfuracidifex tepidarius]BBG23207.1 hypothetical protein IC006_0491 [Sulfuracidifex tepidarius]BBG25945.1 hypothetical protein IC007_0450 [Sulfuracidifex tepidarius]
MQFGISSTELQTNITISNNIYTIILIGISEKDALELLKRYATDDCINEIKKFIDIKNLASLVLWLLNTFNWIRISSIDLAEDIESSQPLFVEIHLDNCGWDEWKEIARSTKDTLNREGIHDIASKVIIVCDQAIQAI